MRVRIVYSIVVPDDYRREIRRHYGQDGLATRAEVQEWYRAYGASMDDELGSEADENSNETTR